jgi:hypothetical protein
MTVAATSIEAFYSSQPTILGAREQVKAYIAAFGSTPCSAFDIGDMHEALYPTTDTKAIASYRQMIHSACHALVEAGEIINAGTAINKATNKRVKTYLINNGVNVPVGKIKRTYKERCEELEAERLVLLRDRAELEMYRTDSVPKDKLADIFYEARAAGNWELIAKLFVRA